MELLSLYALLGFMLAIYLKLLTDSVNNSWYLSIVPIQKDLISGIILQVQVIVLCGTLTYGWYINGGDITFGRLQRLWRYRLNCGIKLA